MIFYYTLKFYAHIKILAWFLQQEAKKKLVNVIYGQIYSFWVQS